MWDAALSTMWAVGRFDRLPDFFSAAAELGFGRFELNHQVDSRMLAEVDLNGCQIDAVHEPCPADISTTTLKDRNWLISSTDDAGRQQGVRAVQRSVDLAKELGAGIIVVHAGQVEVDFQLEHELRRLFRDGQAQTARYQELKERLMTARAEHVEASLDAVRRSILDLLAYAGRAGIRLGLENRYHYLDIPLPDEMERLLDLADDGRLGFWYDLGHAQTLDNLGFFPHAEWLQRFAPRMVGVHLHDIQGLQDHHAAGLGEMDWEMVARYLPADILRTCEIHHSNSPEQVAASMRFLADRRVV
jgi:sugar phosphate isomerase/epimerase